MATTEEIQRRVEEADSATSARRAAAAKQVGELAQRRAAVAEQLTDVETELGDVLAAANDVIDIDELARFTDVSAADLTRWRDGRTSTRTKRKRSTAGVAATKSSTSQRPSVVETPSARQASAPSEPALPGANTADTPARVRVKTT
jgi:hypothetical protein